MNSPYRSLSNKAFHHLPNDLHSLSLFWYLVRGLSNLEFFLSSWLFYRFESKDHAIPWFCPKLDFLSSWFPHRFESEDHAIPWFCPKLDFLSSWFPHRFESEDHAIPWFCPKLDFLSSWFPHRFKSKDHAIPWFCLALRYVEVTSFPTGLSPMTMQYLGSV